VTLLVIKKYWELTCSFVRNHWRWLVVLGAMLVCYLLGKGAQRKLRLDRDLAAAQWEKERRQIEDSYQKEIHKREKARKTYDKAIKAAETKKAEAVSELEKQKAEEVKRHIKKAKSDPDEVDRILKEQFNIEEI
jgi:F0F1-type ATP synthase membrane subunit b/b'